MKKEIYILAIAILCNLFLVGEGFFFDFNNKVFAAGAPTVQATIKITVCGNNIKETGEQCDGTDLSGASCTGLGYSGGTLGCSVACERLVSPCISTAPQTLTTTTISSSSGGEVTLTNANNTTVVFDFPQNFYSENLKLEANSYASNFFASIKPAPSGKNFVGKTYDFSFVIPSGAQAGTQIPVISASTSITINYLDSDISGLNESTLAPYQWGANDTSWQLISGATIDTANNKVAFFTTHFSSFALFGSPVSSSSTPSSGNSGGGGGGGSVPISVTKVVLQGKAYPGAEISILIDGSVATMITANSSAVFKTEITTLSAGVYTFGLWAEDKDGRKSVTFSFTVTVLKDVTTTISNIFIPPTIELDKTTILRGESLNILGQTAPDSDVNIHVQSEEIVKKTESDSTGDWEYLFDTSSLEEGYHTVRAKVEDQAGLLSSFSKVLGFGVGKYSVSTACPKADFNKDGKTNLIDFSILLYWWGKYSPCVDQNQDGIVNLADFSILMYWWTG